MARGGVSGLGKAIGAITGATLLLACTGQPSAESTSRVRSALTAQGLVAAFNFDEGSGSALTDVTPNANNGAISGATWAPGVYGGGALIRRPGRLGDDRGR